MYLYDCYQIIVRLIKDDDIQQDIIEEKIKIIKTTPWVIGRTYKQNAPNLLIAPVKRAPIPSQLGIDTLIFAGTLLKLLNSAAMDFQVTFGGDELMLFRTAMEEFVWVAIEISNINLCEPEEYIKLSPEFFERKGGKLKSVLYYYTIVQECARSFVWSAVSMKIKIPIQDFSASVLKKYPSLFGSKKFNIITTHLEEPETSGRNTYRNIEGLMKSGIQFINASLKSFKSLKRAPSVVRYQIMIVLLLLDYFKSSGTRKMVNMEETLNQYLAQEWMSDLDYRMIDLNKGQGGIMRWKWLLEGKVD